MEAPGRPGEEQQQQQHRLCHPPPGSQAAMDRHLRSQGLRRKRVAKDGSCLFRAVAEQVFYSQTQHIAIRKACINYLRKNREKFEEFIEGSFEDYLKSLENPQEWVGQVEISALSLMYKKDFIIYQEPNSAPSHVTENGFHDKVLLCFSNGSHYDIIYPVEYTLRAALCQSILYELLYEKVFEVSKVLERLNSPDVTKDGDGHSDISDSEEEDLESEASATSDSNGLKPSVGKKQIFKNGNPTSATLPSQVLRSLNPSVYQNIEYEVWQQSKKEQQRQDFSIAAGMQYSVGDKCQVRLDHNGKFYNAHIQEVQSANGPVIVFVEELGAKHSVLLKNLKPLPQGSPMGSWNTVSGKKMKRPILHAQNVLADADCRGSKNPNKPTKSLSVLPPRLQGVKQHHLPGSGMHSQQISPEHKSVGKNPLQAVRKVDRERTEDFDCTSKDCNYFSHSPEELKEKQAREETHSFDEIQFWDEDAFPALSNSSVSQVATQTPNNCGRRKPLVSNGRRNSSLKEEKERENVESKEEKDCNPRQICQDQKLEPKVSESNGEEATDPRVSPPSNDVQSQSVENLQEQTPSRNPPPSSDFPEMHLPPTVPSIPTIVPAWPSEPTSYGPTGVPPQIPASSVMPTPISGGLDCSLSQTQVTSSPVAGIPVSLQAVNQPLMHMPQTLNPYQDPLYPGFPLNEKGERVMTPPYSLCSTGEDLPNDKNILRFFFNLGVKAYSCPMWAPHSYLYPLHQACLTACRMYPKVPVPVYSHTPWLQEVPLTQNGNDAAQTEGPFTVQNDVRMNGQSPQTDMSPAMPLFIPSAQVPENQGLICIEPETPPQALQAEYDESLGGKSLFPQPPFGQNPFLGPVPVAPIFPPLWYGYPVQGYVDNSMVRPVAVSAEDKGGDGYVPREHSSPIPEAGAVESLPKAKQDGSPEGISPPVTAAKNECNVLNKTSTRVPREKPSSPAALSPTPPKPVPHNPSTETQGIKIQTESAVVTNVPETEMKSAPLRHKEKTEKVGAAANMSTSSSERRVQRPREESSEDECEVSDMLRSGRSKQFYNQTYGGGRRPRSEWSYPPGRGGYHHPRNEEYWKGPPPTRNRDENYQHHRSYRGRPYRNERRRANMGNGQRGPHLP